jgi:hypothetical protein
MSTLQTVNVDDLRPADYVIKIKSRTSNIDLSSYNDMLLIYCYNLKLSRVWHTLQNNKIIKIYFAVNDEISIIRS